MARHPLILLALALVLRSGAAVLLGPHPFDDTFITFRYALNLAAGHGFVFNLGERVLGTTTPLWALLLAGLHALGAPLPATALALSLLADAATAILMWHLLDRLGFPVWVSLAGPLLFLAVFDALSISRSGMEAPLFAALVMATLSALAAGRPAAAGCAAGLAALTRPEGLVLLPLLLLAGVLLPGEMPLRRRLLGAALAAAILGAWAVFAVGYFGSCVPQSIVAKASHVAQDPGLARFSWMNLALFATFGQFGGGIYQRTLLQLNFLLIPLAGVGAAGLLLKALREGGRAAWLHAVLLIWFPLGYIAGLALSHAFTWFPWYYGPIYPFAALLAAAGASTARRAGPVLIALLVAGQLAAAVRVKLPADRDFMIAGYLQSAGTIPREPGVRVAALEIGAVGWKVWPLPVIDLLGLVTPEAVGREPLDVLHARLPEYLVVRTDDAAPLLARAGRESWFAASYLRQTVVRDPWSPREFIVFRRRPPAAASDDPVLLAP
ncbi:MAG TPA: hypothetical protein VEW48_25205 [Thermoanaerobaculia bacterium]|nr:hypothetical protein [Thermoanaerobaculia bacterium]